MAAFRAAITEDVLAGVWARAAKFDEGLGLEAGTDLTVHRRVIGHLAKRGQPKLRGLVLTSCAGACWPAEKRFTAG